VKKSALVPKLNAVLLVAQAKSLLPDGGNLAAAVTDMTDRRRTRRTKAKAGVAPKPNQPTG
jgi:hypothetical protein